MGVGEGPMMVIALQAASYDQFIVAYPNIVKRTDIIIVANNGLMTIVHFDFMPLNVLPLVLVLA